MKAISRHSRDPEFFHRAAASLISRRLTMQKSIAKRSTENRDAISGLLDLIAGDMQDLSLKDRLPFFLSAVVIVAEMLASVQGDACTNGTTVRPAFTLSKFSKAV